MPRADFTVGSRHIEKCEAHTCMLKDNDIFKCGGSSMTKGMRNQGSGPLNCQSY